MVMLFDIRGKRLYALYFCKLFDNEWMKYRGGIGRDSRVRILVVLCSFGIISYLCVYIFFMGILFLGKPND